MDLGLEQVLRATGGRLGGEAAPPVITSYHTDSREVRPGGLFFALRGAERDGHQFCADALSRGAGALVVSRPTGLKVAEILVENPWGALFDLARWVLDSVHPVVVGVTGSNGKTSTKEMVAAALSESFKVHRTPGNLNTETGVPLTVLQMPPDTDVLVAEMGMQGAGEIARLAALCRPRVGVVTGIGSVHAEHFSDGVGGVARAKAELLDALAPDGLAVLNADDPRFEELSRHCRCQITSFGLRGGELRGSGYRLLATGCVLDVAGVAVRLAVSGRHQARNALAALAVARGLGVPIEVAAPRLASVRLESRLSRHWRHGFVILEDAYNASPESMEAAFEVARETPCQGSRYAVLGEMLELGGEAREAHRRIGRLARRSFDQVAVVDSGWGRELAAGAAADLLGRVEAAPDWIRSRLRPGDLLLIKASHGVGLYRLLDLI